MALRDNGYEPGLTETPELIPGLGSDPEVPPDEVYEILSNHRRRYAIHLLKHRNERISIGELAEQIAAWENNTQHERVTAHERKLAYNALQQRHLPKLDTVGLVDYDSDRGMVEPRTALSDLSIYTEVTAGRAFPWSDYYLGLALVNGVLLVAAWGNVIPMAALSSFAWAVFCVTSFAVSAMAHAIMTRRMALGRSETPPELPLTG